MIRYECDKCGASMGANDSGRFIVRLEMFAASSHIELDTTDQAQADRGLKQVLDHLAKANPDEIEDQTYRCLRFDLCDPCRRALLQQPLG